MTLETTVFIILIERGIDHGIQFMFSIVRHFRFIGNLGVVGMFANRPLVEDYVSSRKFVQVFHFARAFAIFYQKKSGLKAFQGDISRRDVHFIIRGRFSQAPSVCLLNFIPTRKNMNDFSTQVSKPDSINFFDIIKFLNKFHA